MDALGAAAGNRFPAIALLLALMLTGLAVSTSPHQDTTDLTGDATEAVTSWYLLPDMAIERSSPAVVLLQDGKVLVAGGLTALGPTASTEVYDPALKVWTAGPAMLSARVGHTATLLTDGTVLVTGGETGAGSTTGAEILDPAKGTALALQNMNFARSAHAAIRLADGSVLVTGGTDWVSGPWAQAERYDPASHSWVPAGTMAEARLFFTIEMLPTGDVIAVGGDDTGTSEVYSQATGSWLGLAQMAAPRYNHATAVLGDGTVLAAGGLSDQKATAACELYDPSSDTWTPAAEMTTPRAHFTLTALSNGSLLAAGSWSGDGTTASCELYDGHADTWSVAPAMNVPRGAHGCAVLPDGTVMVAGGVSGTVPTASAEAYASEGVGPVPPDDGLCEPEDIIPLVVGIAGELPGHSEHGFAAQLMAAQVEFELGNITECLEIMDAFYHHVSGFWRSGHMSDESAAMLYDAYAEVVFCLDGTPLPPVF